MTLLYVLIGLVGLIFFGVCVAAAGGDIGDGLSAVARSIRDLRR